MGVAIVAIPSEQDSVWKFSSEKVPHMTLLFLGDIEDQGPELAAIESFIQHIVDTSLPRFGMSVDRRGTLGPEDADVLFFNEGYSNLVKVARANMLQEPHIRAAYENAEQFDGWTPHLTMGYPATPAKKDDREYGGFNWVNFDKLALWIGDYTGPTFDLQDEYDDYPGSSDTVSMSDSLGTAYAGIQLEHSGVKGMKWGVHHEKRLQLLKRVANGTASKTEKIHVALTEVSGDSVKQSGSLAAAAHHKAGELEARKTRIQKGEGTFKDRVALAGGDRLRETSGRTAKKKADSEKPSPFAKHSLAGVELDADILEHHGVKGMHWGVRNDRGHEGEQASGKQIAKADKKFEKSFKPSVANWVKVNNEFANHINPMLDELNSRPEYGRDLTQDRDLHDRYFRDYEKVVEKAASATTKSFGTNASGTREMKVTRSGFGENATWQAELSDVKHANSDGVLEKFNIIPKFDSTGHIVGQTITDPDETEPKIDVVKHAEDILAHHGVKGMKWGVRRDTDAGGSGTPDTANTDRSGYSTRPITRAKQEVKERTGSEVIARTTPGKGVRTVGGNQREASTDAIRARTAQQVAKKSTLDALSNKELQDLVTRMNLEQQYNRLAFEEADSRASAGEKYTKQLINEHGDTAVKALAANPSTAAIAVPVGLALSGFKAQQAFKNAKLANAPGAQSKKNK